MRQHCISHGSLGWLASATALCVGLSCATGCGSQSRVAKLQEAAQNYNMAARFGRMDVATEHVSSKEMDEFAKRHAQWGSYVRVMDVEYQGLRFANKDQAVVLVAVAWQRVDEPELRVTHLAQVWAYERNGWKLVEEERTAGDAGLLGEPTEVLRPAARPDVHYPSITIR